MDGGGMKVNGEGVTPAECKATLRGLCPTNKSATPSAWNRLVMYNVPNGGNGATTQNFTDYTAEFLLTRGPYAMLGCEGLPSRLVLGKIYCVHHVLNLC